jgi:hypothetical protein
MCKSNDHYRHVMNMFRLTLAIAAIRMRLRLSLDLEEGTKRQKHGDVLFESLPREYEGIATCRVLSLALTAMARSDAHSPAACLEARARSDVLVLSYSESCFIRKLCHHQQRTSTDACYSSEHAHCRVWWSWTVQGGANAHQSAHGADGLFGAPSLPSLDLSGFHRQLQEERHSSPLTSRPQRDRPGAMGAMPVSLLTVAACCLLSEAGRFLGPGLGCPDGGASSMRC